MAVMWRWRLCRAAVLVRLLLRIGALVARHNFSFQLRSRTAGMGESVEARDMRCEGILSKPIGERWGADRLATIGGFRPPGMVRQRAGKLC
jgi:hypothetical protein